MDMIELIEKKRIALGIKKSDAARALGIPSQNYNNWVYRNSLPKSFFSAAQQFLKDSDFSTVSIPGSAVKKMLPILAWSQVSDFLSNKIDESEISEHCPCPVSCDSGFVLRVTGDSMTATHPGERSYPEGCIIFIDTDKEVVSGSRVVALLGNNDEAIFKTYTEDSGKRFLMPINSRYQTIEMDESTQIVGVVIASMVIE